MEVGPTGAQLGSDPTDTGYAARFSGREIVEKQLEVGSEYLVLWAKDSEYAYYDSKVAPKCPGLGRRDPLREAVETARGRLPLIAYCVIQGNGYPLRRHPEYRMLDAEGKPIGRICLNSGFLEHAKELLAEMLAYGIDGFHVDMLDQGFGPPYGCWCANCRTRFERQHGRPMPKGVTWDADWERMLEFRYETSARFERELRRHVRKLSPRASVDFNYHGYPPFSWEVGQRPVEHAHLGDFVTGETGVWGFSALGVGLTARFLAATKPGAVHQVAMQRGVRMYHDMTCRPLNDLRWEMMTLLAHGTQVTVVDKTPYDGTLDPITYGRMKPLFAEVRAKREHFGHEPVEDVGLYYSSRSRDWYGREDPARYQQAFTGAHKALVYEHMPFGVLLDENLSAEGLRRFPVVCLPNAAILLPGQVSLLREYVAGGGSLVVTGLSGLLGPRGESLQESVLAELVGAKLVRRLPSLDNHVRFPAVEGELAPLVRDLPPGSAFLVEGPAVVLEPTTAKPLGELLRPHRTVRQQKGLEGTEWPSSADAPVGPAVLVNRLGKGRVVCLACSPDHATAGEHRIVEARRLLVNAVRFLHPRPAIEVSAPRNVESVVTRDEARRVLRVHLLGYLSPPASTPGKNRPYVLPEPVEDALWYRATITVRAPIREVRALGPGTAIRRQGDRIEATVQDVHEVIVVGY